MPELKWPFHVERPGEPPRPMLLVRVSNPATGLFVDAWGVVDTGADDCALPAVYARLLGHRLKAGTRRLISTGNGDTWAYAHTTRIDIFCPPPGSHLLGHPYTIADAPIDFMPNLGCVLLGTRSFLSRFVLTLNYPRQYLTLRTR